MLKVIATMAMCMLKVVDSLSCKFIEAMYVLKVVDSL